MTRRSALLTGTAAAALALVPGGPALCSDAPLALKWVQLIPPPDPSEPRKLKPFFPTPPAGREGHPSQTPGGSDGKFMSMKSQQPDTDKPPAVVKELDGKRVQIGGYIVPLDFDATKIKEFLLVPFVGACIHVPPPPPNQIIYVKSEKGVEISGSFDPVMVTGRLTTEIAFTGLADAGYKLDAETVTHIKR